MISQLPLRAFENNRLENLISRMQLTGGLLSRHPQAACPRQKLRPVDNVSSCAPPLKPDSFQAAALMLHSPPGTASSRLHAA
jgi:hypothetical protein